MSWSKRFLALGTMAIAISILWVACVDLDTSPNIEHQIEQSPAGKLASPAITSTAATDEDPALTELQARCEGPTGVVGPGVTTLTAIITDAEGRPALGATGTWDSTSRLFPLLDGNQFAGSKGEFKATYLVPDDYGMSGIEYVTFTAGQWQARSVECNFVFRVNSPQRPRESAGKLPDPEAMLSGTLAAELEWEVTTINWLTDDGTRVNKSIDDLNQILESRPFQVTASNISGFVIAPSQGAVAVLASGVRTDGMLASSVFLFDANGEFLAEQTLMFPDGCFSLTGGSWVPDQSAWVSRTSGMVSGCNRVSALTLDDELAFDASTWFLRGTLYLSPESDRLALRYYLGSAVSKDVVEVIPFDDPNRRVILAADAIESRSIEQTWTLAEYFH